MDGMRDHLIENTSLLMMGRHEIWDMRLRIKMLEGQVRDSLILDAGETS